VCRTLDLTGGGGGGGSGGERQQGASERQPPPPITRCALRNNNNNKNNNILGADLSGTHRTLRGCVAGGRYDLRVFFLTYYRVPIYTYI